MYHNVHGRYRRLSPVTTIIEERSVSTRVRLATTSSTTPMLLSWNRMFVRR